MKKETIIKIFEKNKKNNFTIVTNIGVGRGINGVDFEEYVGYTKSNQGIEETKVLGFMEDCIVLENYRNCGWRKGGTHTIYLPFECITTIDFTNNSRNEECFPTKLPKEIKHNLKEIK